MRVRVSWRGNATGKKGWLVLWDRTELTARLLDGDGWKLELETPAEPLACEVIERKDDLLQVEVAFRRWSLRPRTLRFTAKKRTDVGEAGTASRTASGVRDAEWQTVVLVDGRMQRLAVGLAVFFLPMLIVLAWLGAHYPMGTWGELAKSVLATSFGAALLAEIRSFRDPRTLPFFGLLHAPLRTGSVLVVLGLATLVVPRWWLGSIHNRTDADISLHDTDERLELKPDDQILVRRIDDGGVSSLGDQIPDFESRFCAATGEDSGCGAAYARPRLIAALDISYTAIVCAGQRWNAAQTWLPDGGDAGIALNPDCTRKEARPVVELDGNALMKGALDPTPDGGAGPTADAKATLRFVPPQPTELADARWFEQFRSDVRVAFRVANDGARLESADLLTTGSRDFQSATLRFEQRDARPVITPVPAESTWMALHVLSAGSDHELGVLSCSFPKSTTTLDVWQIPSSNGVESLAIQDGVDTTSRWTASESAPAWACLPHDAPARRSPTSTGEIHLLPGWYASNAWSVSVPSPALAQSWAVYTTGAVFLGSLGCRQTAGAQRVVAVRLGPASVPGAGKLVTPALYTRYDDGAWASRWSSGTGAPWVCSPGIDGGPGAAARFYTADPGSLDASGGAAFSFSDYTAPFPTAKGKKCNVWSSSPRGAPAPDGLKCPLAQPPWLAFYESYWVAQGCDPGQLSVCE